MFRNDSFSSPAPPERAHGRLHCRGPRPLVHPAKLGLRTPEAARAKEQGANSLCLAIDFAPIFLPAFRFRRAQKKPFRRPQALVETGLVPKQFIQPERVQGPAKPGSLFEFVKFRIDDGGRAPSLSTARYHTPSQRSYASRNCRRHRFRRRARTTPSSSPAILRASFSSGGLTSRYTRKRLPMLEAFTLHSRKLEGQQARPLAS